jgi:hypothetical protein
MQWVRTPSARAWLAGGWNDASMALLATLVADEKVFAERAKESMPEASETDVKEILGTARDFLRAKGARIEVDQTTIVRETLKLAVHIEDELAKRCWLLGMAPDDTPAITSDDPVVLEWNGRGVPPRAWNPGVGDPETVVLVALGPRHILAGVPGSVPGRRRRDLKRQQVAHFNSLVALKASRFVYFAGESFAFERDGQVVDGPTDWLKRRPDDVREGKKRGRLTVLT